PSSSRTRPTGPREARPDDRLRREPGPIYLQQLTRKDGSRLALRAAGMTTSVRHHVFVGDHSIELLLYLDPRADPPRVAQGAAGVQARVSLGRADRIVGQPGALLELLVDHVLAQLGHADEDPLELVIVGERVLARLLVGGEHPLGDIGMILEEFLARIEDAPGVGVGIAVEQAGAVEELGARPHPVASRPRPGAR